MTAQGLIGVGLGVAVGHIGMGPKGVSILIALIIAAKLVACVGWFFEACRMDNGYSRGGFLTGLKMAQGAIAFIIGILVMHVGFAATAAVGLAFVVVIAKALWWTGWRRQALL